MLSFLKSKHFQILVAVLLGAIIMMLPRPEGTQFRVSGDSGHHLFDTIKEQFSLVPSTDKTADSYIVEVRDSAGIDSVERFLKTKSAEANIDSIQIETVNGLSPKAMRFLAILAALIFLFLVEPIPLEITAILIGVSLVAMQIVDVKTAWAPYMHPVVVFIMVLLDLRHFPGKGGPDQTARDISSSKRPARQCDPVHLSSSAMGLGHLVFLHA